RSNQDLQRLLLEYQQIEKELRESEKKYRTLVETMNEGFILCDKNQNITYINKSFLKMTQYPEEEIIGRPFSDFCNHDSKQRLSRQKELRKKGIRDPYEIILEGKKGDKIHCIVSPQAIFDKKEAFAGSFATITNISGVKEAERILRQNEAHLRSLMESATNFAIFRLSKNETDPSATNVVFVSPSIRDILCVDTPIDFGTWLDNIHPEDNKLAQETSGAIFKAEMLNQTLRIRHPETRQPHWIQIISKGIREIETGTSYANGIIVDISRLKTAEEELKQKSGHLQELNTALKILLERRDEDQRNMEERMLYNVKTRIMPHLERLKQANLNERLSRYLEAIEDQLMDVVSPFIQGLSSRFLDLTPTEIQVADYIREGKTS
ncbi:MAG: PAS domain S-box protein, partial [Thermodesulfobacteriota bacterium]